MPNTVPVYSTATSRYSRMHSTVCSQLSKVKDLMMKNTTPRITGTVVSHRAFLPSSTRQRIKRMLHIRGSAICVAAKKGSSHLPQQPTMRNTADSAMKMMAVWTVQCCCST